MEKVDKKLQIDRILFFSDAVIAIAITLLIIEIKAPHLTHNTGTHEMQEMINELIRKFIAFFISFFVIAIYWKAHHHMYGYLKGYTDRLIWLNTLFLLTIVIMPFSSAFYSENFGYNIPYAFYCINIALTGFLNFWIIRYISSARHQLSTVSGDMAWRKYYSRRSLVAPMVFFLSMALSFYSTTLSRLSFLLIFPIIYYLKRNYEKGQIHHS